MLLALILAASPVAQAANDYSDLNYESCVARLERVRHGPKERPTAELLLGLCHFALGHDRLARTFIESALRRDPNVAIPASASPKERALIDELRPSAAATRKRERDRERDRPPSAAVAEPTAEPPSLPTDTPLVAAAPTPAPAAPSPVPEAGPPPPLPPPALVEAPPPARATWLPVVTGGLAVAAAGVGVGFGVSSQNLAAAGRAEPVQIIAAQQGTDAQTHATVANVAFAVAGTAAVGTLITWLVTR